MSHSHLSQQCDAAFFADDDGSRMTLADRESLSLTSSEGANFVEKDQSVTSTADTSARRSSKISSTTRRLTYHLRPHLGLAALCIASCTTIFSLAVLISSNEKAVASWAFRPAVYLAIASAIANSAVAFAYAEGTGIAWWRRASKGTTIRALARQWEAGSSVVQALQQTRHMNMVVATAMLITLIAADGPLLQAASRVVPATQRQPVTLGLSIAPEVPTGFSGWSGNRGTQYNLKDFTKVTQEWLRQVPISITVHPPCQGTCRGIVKGPGVAKTNCSTTTWPITHEMWYNGSATWGPWSGHLPIGNLNFVSNPIFIVDLLPHVVGSPGAAQFLGTFAETRCGLIPVVRTYTVAFSSNHEVTIQVDSGAELNNGVLAIANNTSPRHPHQSGRLPLTLDAFTGWLITFVASNASAVAYSQNSTAAWVLADYTFNAQAEKYWWQSGNGRGNTGGFRDPTPDIISQFNDLMFRAGVKAAALNDTMSRIDPGLSLHQSITANQTIHHNVFQSDFRWYAGATLLELIVVLAVLPLFRDYRKLDKQLDLSPFAIGLAFNAPLLGDADPEGGAAGVLERLGDVRIRYGDVVGADRLLVEEADGIAEHGRLGFGRSEGVRMPPIS